jgi:DNA-binding transcriptional LysR family regulator
MPLSPPATIRRGTPPSIDDVAKRLFRTEERTVLDWDLIRYFLAVARSGSTLTASRELGQSQPTVARRIAALERSIGAALFDRRQAGYRLTERGRALLAEAEAVETAAFRFAETAGAQERRIAGTVRFTTFDMFANLGLGATLQAFGERYPDIRVEVIVTDKVLDLGAGEADVALRGGPRPTEARLVARKVAETEWTAYCSRSYAAAHGRPASLAELDGHVLIAGDGNLERVPALRWLLEHAPHSPVRYRSNTVQHLAASVKAGLGISMLPVAFFPRDDDLLPLLPPPPELRSEGWLVTHERIRHEPHIRALTDFFAEFIRKRTRAASADQASI